jgi:hypothetical protein
MERLANLETDHYRISLQLEEISDDSERSPLHQQRHELERRMNIHLRALSSIPEEIGDPAVEDSRPADQEG